MTFSRDEELLLENYRNSLDLLKHEDERKEHLTTLSISLNGGILAFYLWLADNSPSLAIGLVVFSIVFNIYWAFLMARMRAFIGLRYFLLKEIERQLDGLVSITSEETLRDSGRVTVFDKTYTLKLHQHLSVTKTESILPLFIASFWVYLAFVVFAG